LNTDVNSTLMLSIVRPEVRAETVRQNSYKLRNFPACSRVGYRTRPDVKKRR
jgi:hypothetical protein